MVFVKFSKTNIFGIWSIFTIHCNSAVNNDELAKLLYDRFRFGEFDIVKINYSAMKVIKVKVRAGVDIEQHKNTSAYSIRPGLWVLPMKEIKQEKRIKLSWLPNEVTNEEITEVLELFGTVTGQATDLKFQIDDRADELTKRLRNFFCNDRKIEMVVERNIPSYMKIKTGKLKCGIVAKISHVQGA